MSCWQPLHYPVEIDGVERRVELPFVTAVLADFSGQRPDPPPLADRVLQPIDRDSFDDHLAAIAPRLALDDGTELRFTRLADFDAHPAHAGHPALLRLAATWHALHRLVERSETDESLKIVLLDAGKAELAKLLRRYRGTAWDQSPLFKRLYDERYARAGGEPVGCLLVDHAFDHAGADVETLGELAKIGAACHAVVVVEAAPSLLQLDRWAELPHPRDLTKIFSMPEYAAWRSLRESDDARQLVVTVPRWTARAAADAADAATATPWAGAGWLLAEAMHRSFSWFGWPHRTAGLSGGGAVEGVACEVPIGERRDAELARCGLAALIAHGAAGIAVFTQSATLARPAEYDDPDATENARVAAQLRHVLVTGRLAHHLKAIARDVLAGLRDRAAVQAWLDAWIAQFAQPAARAPGPLPASPRVLPAVQFEVEEIPGQPGFWTTRFFVGRVD